MDEVIPGEVEESVYIGGTETATGLQGADLSASRALAPVSSPKSAILLKNTEGIASATAMCWQGSPCCCWWW